VPQSYPRTFLSVQDLVPAECADAIVVPTSGADAPVCPRMNIPGVLVMAHRVRTVIAADGSVTYDIPTLPREPGIYFGMQRIGIGYVGVAHEDTLAGRVPKSMRENLPGDPEWVLTATSLGPQPFTAAQALHAEALLIAATRRRWHTTNDKFERRQDLPQGPLEHAEHAAKVLEYAVETFLSPLPHPVYAQAAYHRALFGAIGVPLDRETGVCLEGLVAGREWSIQDPWSAFARNLAGRADSGARPLAPAGFRQDRGRYAPAGWSATKFVGREFGLWRATPARTTAQPKSAAGSRNVTVSVVVAVQHEDAEAA
jgi:hypothetical protein